MILLRRLAFPDLSNFGLNDQTLSRLFSFFFVGKQFFGQLTIILKNVQIKHAYFQSTIRFCHRGTMLRPRAAYATIPLRFRQKVSF
jgi:hypothetical protein